MNHLITDTTALLIVDLQNDFLPTGALPVHDGDLVVPYVNSIMDNYTYIIATKDWHPQDHMSFASNHPSHNIGDSIVIEAIRQTLWPDHCVQNTTGADFAKGLHTEKIQDEVKKADDKKTECYSGFLDCFLNKTTLDDVIKKNNIDTLHICGLATDYCVKHTACDALSLGYKVYLLTEGIRGVNIHPDDSENAIQFMKDRGITII